ncbi:hypothetical protein GGF32_004067 [Allomyces javanicus]|nr:hypothetical protein GGF32_004067 [Allomyces javanicus]
MQRIRVQPVQSRRYVTHMQKHGPVGALLHTLTTKLRHLTTLNIDEVEGTNIDPAAWPKQHLVLRNIRMDDDGDGDKAGPNKAGNDVNLVTVLLTAFVSDQLRTVDIDGVMGLNNPMWVGTVSHSVRYLSFLDHNLTNDDVAMALLDRWMVEADRKWTLLRLDIWGAKNSESFTDILERVTLSLFSMNLHLSWEMSMDARLTVLKTLSKVLPMQGDHDATALWKSWVAMVRAMPRSLSMLSLNLQDKQYPEEDFDVSDGILLELVAALPVVTDSLDLRLPWWTEEMAVSIPIAPTLRRVYLGHTFPMLASFPLALVVSRLPQGIVAFGIRNCAVGAFDLLATPEEAFPNLEELVLHNVMMPDESEPDALTEDMNLVEMLLGIFASDRLRILDLDETKAVDADAAWVEQVPRSVHSLTVLVHKLQNKDLADALLEQYAGASAERRVHHRKLRFYNDCSWTRAKVRELKNAPGLEVDD